MAIWFCASFLLPAARLRQRQNNKATDYMNCKKARSEGMSELTVDKMGCSNTTGRITEGTKIVTLMYVYTQHNSRLQRSGTATAVHQPWWVF
jgi:hypothetical protein